jgi:hypothetical protein
VDIPINALDAVIKQSPTTLAAIATVRSARPTLARKAPRPGAGTASGELFSSFFSVPHALVPLIWQNKKVLFKLLFEASSATLLLVICGSTYRSGKPFEIRNARNPEFKTEKRKFVIDFVRWL